MKNAIVQAYVIDIICPYCDEPQTRERDGGTTFTLGQDETMDIRNKRDINCTSCAKRFRLPRQCDY